MGTDLALTESRQVSLFDASAQQIETALKAAELWAQSQVVPARYHNRPADILVAVEMGRRYNLAPFDALRSIYAIDGTPSLSAAMVYGLCRAHPAWNGLDENELTDSSGEIVGYQFCAHRKGAKSITRVYTMDDAKAAGLTGRKNWQRMRRRMLLVRARHYTLCDQYPEIVLGMGVVDVSEDGTLDSMNDATSSFEKQKVVTAKPSTIKEQAQANAEAVGAVPTAAKLSAEKVETILGEFYQLKIDEEQVAEMIGRSAQDWDDHDLPNLRKMLQECKSKREHNETETKSK